MSTPTRTPTINFRDSDVLYVSTNIKESLNSEIFHRMKTETNRMFPAWAPFCSFKITVNLMQHLQSLKSTERDEECSEEEEEEETEKENVLHIVTIHFTAECTNASVKRNVIDREIRR